MRASNSRLWSGVVLAVLMLGGTAGTRALADDPPVSVVDWLKAKGQDSSLDARRALFTRLVGGEAYSGSVEQNMRLLKALQAPKAPAQPRTIRQHDLEVTYDVSSLVMSLELAESVRWASERTNWRDPAPPERTEEPPVLPTLPADGSAFVSAAVLSQKAKQFDDGMYAAVEEAFEGGTDGKREMLRRLRERLASAGARDAGAEVVEAAARLGNAPGKGPASIDAAVAARVSEFLGDAKRSKPLGFYPWTEELKRVFQQDRMLQTKLGRADARSVVDALKADPEALSTYLRMLRCYERLTNPYVSDDLRVLLEPGTGPASDEPVCVLPASRAHETDLFRRLWGDRPIPDGADLMNMLVEKVRSGEISLAPTAKSGWYDRQTWSFEPILRPETTPEASHLRIGDRYRKYLVELFKGLLAQTRETHVKQLELGCPTMMAQPVRKTPISVALPFTVEPLPTHYARRAEAYAFVRTVLDDTFGVERVKSLRRLTADGPVALDLASELEFMERLFRGAAETSRSEIGASDTGVGAQSQADRESFRAWAAGLASDRDLSIDARMMVPVFFDPARQSTKVWAFLGWTRETLITGVATPPRVLATKPLAELPNWDGTVNFYAPGGVIYAPVVAEVYVREILDRSQMRRRCDEGRTRSAILASLK